MPVSHRTDLYKVVTHKAGCIRNEANSRRKFHPIEGTSSTDSTSATVSVDGTTPKDPYTRNLKQWQGHGIVSDGTRTTSREGAAYPSE